MFKKLKGYPVLCFLGIEICIVFILFVFCFRITYNPELDNNWDAIGACGTWFCGCIVPLAVIFIEERIREKEKETERRIQDSEARTSSSNLALLEELNNSKYKNKFASGTTSELTKDDVYRYICISITTSTKEIIEYFKGDKEEIIEYLKQLFFVERRINILSLEDDPRNYIEDCNWRKA